MRVVVSAPTLSRAGGVERYTAEVVLGLVEQGHAVTVVVGHLEVPLPPSVAVDVVRPLPLPGLAGLIAHLATFGPRADRRVRGLGLDGAGATGAAGAVPYRPLGAGLGPGVVTAHSCHAAWLRDRDVALGPRRPNPLDRILLRQERRTFAHPEVRVTTVSHRCAAEIAEHHRRDLDQIVVVPPAVDPNQFSPADAEDRRRARASLGLRDDALVVGTVANHAFRRKRVATTAAAVEALGGTLLVAGTVDRGDAAAVTPLVGPHLQLLGPVADMRAFYAALDAFALPSVNEAYGMAAHEAMAVGVPCVVSDRCGIADFLDDGVHALVLPDDQCADAGALAAALRSVRGHEAMARAGAGWAAARTWADVASEIAGVLAGSGLGR